MVDEFLAIWASLEGWRLAAAAATVFIGGLIRGFSGFGHAMVSIPLLSLLYDPQTAVAVLVAGELPALPRLIGMARRGCDWKRAVPMGLASAATLPAGAYVLLVADQEVLRIIISILVLIMVAMLASGWRTVLPDSRALDAGVGVVCGGMSGSTGLGGPPIILYMMMGGASALAVRATITGFFLFSTTASTITFIAYGFLDARSITIALVTIPTYILALAIGGRMFHLASEETFRRVAYAVLIGIAVGTLLA